MQSYLNLLHKIRQHGELRPNRTGTDAYSIFGHQLRINLQQGFPLLTTKKVHFPSVVHELLWFISGDTNVKYLQDNGVRIWDEWADKQGELGPVYGKQWRGWQAADGKQVDQLKQVMRSLRQDPHSRRHIIAAWNVGELDKMALAPCHILFQFYVDGKQRLSCHLYQRSADVFLGVPFNIASYSLLTMMMAHVLELQAGELLHSFGDAHLYINHLVQADEQLTRQPLSLPRLELNSKVDDIFAFTYDDITLRDYEPHPQIKAQVAV